MFPVLAVWITKTGIRIEYETKGWFYLANAQNEKYHTGIANPIIPFGNN